MNTVSVVRIAKAIALIGFFLPWVLVSCSSQPIASFSGVSLAMGDFSFRNPVNGAIQHQHVSPNLFLVVAIFAIAGGLAYTFRAGATASVKQTARILLAAAAVGAACSAVGVMTVMSSRDQAISQAQNQNQFAGGVASAIQMNLQYGFWITLLALAVAGGAAWLLMTDREAVLSTIGGEARRLAAVAGGGSHDDETYWDRLPDKNDPSALEEYLHRFPSGKLASLARARLQRRGFDLAAAAGGEGPPPELAPAAVEPGVAQPPEIIGDSSADKAVACAGCGASIKESDRFCGACGSALAGARAGS